MDSELTILKEQITSLRAEVSTFQETKVAVGELRTTFSSIDNKFLLSERLSILEKELTNWKTLAQYLGVTFSIAALVFGYLGYQSLDKFLGEQITKRLDYSANLSYGLALTDQHPDFSVYYLRKCFAEKPFDEPLIISLLHSADTADDWATAKEVVEKLLKHPDKIGSFTKALTFNNIGIAELDLIFEDKSYLPRAMEALEKGLKIARQDDQTDLWYLHANLWRCFLAKGDLKRAMEEAEKGKEFDPPADVSDWDKARKWLWFEAFFNTKEHIAEEQIQQMYKTLSRTGPGV